MCHVVHVWYWQISSQALYAHKYCALWHFGCRYAPEDGLLPPPTVLMRQPRCWSMRWSAKTNHQSWREVAVLLKNRPTCYDFHVWKNKEAADRTGEDEQLNSGRWRRWNSR